MFFIPGGCPAASAGSGAEPQGVEAAAPREAVAGEG